jgi:hypothetical protein
MRQQWPLKEQVKGKRYDNPNQLVEAIRSAILELNQMVYLMVSAVARGLDPSFRKERKLLINDPEKFCSKPSSLKVINKNIGANTFYPT